MKTNLFIALLLGTATLVSADPGKYAIGFDGSIDNKGETVTGSSDMSASFVTLRALVSIPVGEGEIVPFASVDFVNIKDTSGLSYSTGTDFSQSGFGAGLAYYHSLAAAGPFNFKAGISGDALFWGAPKNSSGTYSDNLFEGSLPVIVDVTVGDWFFRITQPVVTFGVELYDNGVTKHSWTHFSYLSYSPSVGFFKTF